MVFMLVSDVSRFDVVLPSVDLDYQIGDVLEFDVICVRAVAAALEGVESDIGLRAAPRWSD